MHRPRPRATHRTGPSFPRCRRWHPSRAPARTATASTGREKTSSRLKKICEFLREGRSSPHDPAARNLRPRSAACSGHRRTRPEGCVPSFVCKAFEAVVEAPPQARARLQDELAAVPAVASSVGTVRARARSRIGGSGRRRVRRTERGGTTRSSKKNKGPGVAARHESPPTAGRRLKNGGRR